MAAIGIVLRMLTILAREFPLRRAASSVVWRDWARVRGEQPAGQTHHRQPAGDPKATRAAGAPWDRCARRAGPA